MSLYMFLYSVPDEHILFLKQNPKYLNVYLKGKAPKQFSNIISKYFTKGIDNKILENWPVSELPNFCPEISHNQVELFHVLLNGSNEPVSHEGCFFQTWFNPNYKSIALKIDMENFAFLNESVRKLKILLDSINQTTIMERYKMEMDVEEVENEDKDILFESFNILNKACVKSLEDHNGLLWSTM